MADPVEALAYWGNSGNQNDTAVAGFAHTFKNGLDRRTLVAHSHLNRDVFARFLEAPLQQRLNGFSMLQKRRLSAIEFEQLTVDFGGLWRSEGNDDAIDQKASEQPREVNDPWVVEEFTQVPRHIEGGRTVWGAKLYQEDAGFFNHRRP